VPLRSMTYTRARQRNRKLDGMELPAWKAMLSADKEDAAADVPKK
jgi:hypothetical protein